MKPWMRIAWQVVVYTLIVLFIVNAFMMFLLGYPLKSLVFLGERETRIFIVFFSIVTILLGAPFFTVARIQDERHRKRFDEFIKTIKVGQSFYAIQKNTPYETYLDPKELIDYIFHFTIEKIDTGKKYHIELSDEYRPNWHPRRYNFDRYHIFETKEGLHKYIERVTEPARKKMQMLDKLKEML
jgi:type IV secretory pathway VirB3-like protein